MKEKAGREANSAGSGLSRQKHERPLLFGILALTLSGLYLLGPARNAMDGWAAGVVLLHIGLGFLLTVPIGIALWRAFSSARNRLVVPLIAMALLCAMSGYWLFGRAVIGYSAAHDAVVWWAHIIVGLAAALVFLAIYFAGGRRFGGGDALKFLTRGPSDPSGNADNNPALSLSLLLFFLLFPTLLGSAALLPTYAAKDYYRALTATNAAQAENPLFPAGMHLSENNPQTTASRWQEQNPAYCGQKGCHPAAFEEWSHSAHRYAQDDPFYQRVHQDFAARKGEQAARWCAGCHAPQAVLPAPPAPFPAEEPLPNPPLRKGKELDFSPYQGKEREAELSPPPAKGAGGLGVDCVACHASAPATISRTGNARFALELPQTYPFARETGGWKQRLHQFLLRARPGPHQRAFLKPDWHRSAEFCGTCHRQSFGVPQNNFRFVRGMDTFGEWHAGPFSGRTALNAGQTETRPCQNCHFPRQSGKRIAHNSPGANTALPALRGDPTHLAEIERFLKQERITLDIFALRKERPRQSQRRASQPEPWLAPLDAPQESVPVSPGDRVTLDIVVSNRGIGHSFPSGYADIRDAWLEVTLSDPNGRVLLQSGVVESDTAEVPADARVYRMVPLDNKGDLARHHDLDRMTTTAYHRVIPPGGSDIARYVFTLPKVAGSLQIHARLRFRPLRPNFSRWVLNAKHPQLPITTLAETMAQIENEGKGRSREEGREKRVKGKVDPALRTLNSELRTENLAMRFVGYGNGLIAPAGTLERAAALRAFAIAKSLAPDRPEPYIGMGRAYLTEPDFLAARAQFEKALRLAPDHAGVNHLLGYVLSKQGEYERALQILTPLAERFPQDVVLHFDLGSVYARLGRYAEATEAFRRALAADPDYAPAHFQLKRWYQHLRRVPEARQEEAIGKYLAEDEQAPRLRETYLRNHPNERLAAQPIPRHPLHPVTRH